LAVAGLGRVELTSLSILSLVDVEPPAAVALAAILRDEAINLPVRGALILAVVTIAARSGAGGELQTAEDVARS